MAEKIKIHELAKKLKVPMTSTELVKICQRAGFKEIKHHSNAVTLEVAEEIKKAAIRLYRPKEPPPKKKEEPKAAPAVAAKVEEKKPGPAPAPVVKVEEKKPAPAPAVKKEEPKKKTLKLIPTGERLKPLAPTVPKGRKARVAFRREEERREEVKRIVETGAVTEELVGEGGGEKPFSARVAKPPKPEKKTRTVIFKQSGKVAVKKRETKLELIPPVTIRELSEKMGITASDIIKKLMLDHQIHANINESLENETVELLGLDYGVEITFKAPKTVEEMLAELMPKGKPGTGAPRPPVIALLGHVDHGKTSILDRIRHTEVAGSEDGGITQDIGAWQIIHKGHPATFVDTPGHEAFTQMRARGARVTDIVILVVAADDGVMAQTEEAISHARAAGVPIVVALNKIDKPDADQRRAFGQLAGLGLNPEHEEWGGSVGCVPVCAISGQGIEQLIERTLLEAEILDLKGHAETPASGVVLEARMEEGRGVVANAIVRDGTLRAGDFIVCGTAYGKVRALMNDRAQQVESAGPSTPIAILGLNRAPEAGDRFVVTDKIDAAREIAEQVFARVQQQRRQPRHHVTLENLFESLASQAEKHLRIILKVDVRGSLEPIVTSLQKMDTQEVSVRVLHQGIGAVNTSDVLLADASDAIILAFRVTTEERGRALAQEAGVDIRPFRVIYDLVKAVRDGLEGLLAPGRVEERLGVADVRKVFRVSRVGNVAGCNVREGTIRRSERIRLLRDGKVIHEGSIGSLRHLKDDIRAAETGHECGIRVEGYDDVHPGDVIECYTVREVKRVLS